MCNEILLKMNLLETLFLTVKNITKEKKLTYASKIILQIIKLFSNFFFDLKDIDRYIKLLYCPCLIKKFIEFYLNQSNAFKIALFFCSSSIHSFACK